MGQSTGKKVYYLESPVTGWAQMPYNTKEVLTESGEWESPVTGWVKVTCIGGGQAGISMGATTGAIRYSAGVGSKTVFGDIVALPGGPSEGELIGADGSDIKPLVGGYAGEVAVGYMMIQAGEVIPYEIGVGGINLVVIGSSIAKDTFSGFPGSSYISWYGSASYSGACGGNAGSNGTPYGGGGGGGVASKGVSMRPCAGSGNATAGESILNGSSTTIVRGGDGGQGAIILEYADPKKKS